MWVSKKTRYGLRLLIELALNYGNSVTLKEVSKSEGISGKFLEHIVSDLKRAQFVESVRGPKGGYRLIRAPEDISLKDVIDIFEGEGSIVECLMDPLLCERSKYCISRCLWNEADKQINETLRSIKLTEILNKFDGFKKKRSDTDEKSAKGKR